MLELEEPQDYFTGIGQNASLPIPMNILLFQRTTRETLQQEALQNRSHHRFVLVCNVETRGSIHVDNHVLSLGPNQSLLILPYQFHHFSHLESSAIRWLFCTFELSSNTFLEPLRSRVLDTGKGSSEAFAVLLREWYRCRLPKRHEMQEAQLQSALLYLLTSLLEDLQSQAADFPPDPQDSLLRKVNRLMAEWRGHTVGVTDVAHELGLSTSRLRAHFREIAGIPLGSYLLNYRLNRAMALLRTGDLPIAEIAEETGFGSPQAFSRTFRNKTGHTPRAYRYAGHSDST